MGAKPPGRIEPKIFLEEGIRDVITCFKFGYDRFRGLASAEGQILPFPIDFDGRPYNTLKLPCERVIPAICKPLYYCRCHLFLVSFSLSGYLLLSSTFMTRFYLVEFPVNPVFCSILHHQCFAVLCPVDVVQHLYSFPF